MKSQINYPVRPNSSNLEQQTQSQHNVRQNGQFLQTLKSLHKQIEELKDNQQNVSQSLVSNFTNINKKIDAMETLINELTNQPFKSTMDIPKNVGIGIGLLKSQSANTNSTRRPKITEIIQDQKQNQVEQSFSFQKAENSQQIYADNNKSLVESKQIKFIYSAVKSSQSISNEFRQQNMQLNKNVKLNQNQYKQCDLCKGKFIDLIETPCHHFLDKKCLKAQFDQQLMNYDQIQKFYCICKKELYLNFIIKHLQLDGEKWFQKQINIIYQKYQPRFKQCKYCKIFWIYDLYQKTKDSCFHCGQICQA
ncbi:unnamed protein product [Paramecium octaurelia]|uniref:Uncharacterized protein n=1 Tax=Paramecium octaurelia TaxID=43137 RepID=A0A8S1Y021_PAROT|nr:unnamed protein product [Paramecium octaurelia]